MILDEHEGVLIAQPGPDIGMCFFARRGFGDFLLRLQFRIQSRRDNWGVFVRFRDPCRPPCDLGDVRAITNPAWIAVQTGFEVQINDGTHEAGAGRYRTGAIYDIPTADDHQTQASSPGSPIQPGRWNDYEITVSGDSYEVRLNDHVTTVFTNVDRGLSADRDAQSGYIGLQQHTGAVSFRAVRIREDS